MNDESGRELLIDGEKLAFGKNPKRKILSEIKDIVTCKSDTFPDSRDLNANQRAALAKKLRVATKDLLDVVRNGLWSDHEHITMSLKEIDGRNVLALDHGKISFLFEESEDEKILEYRGVAGS